MMTKLRVFMVLVMLVMGVFRALAQDAPAAGADDSVLGWLPDGETLLFLSTRDGAYDLYSMKSDGSDVQRLTTGKTISGAILSPDGTMVALQSSDGVDILTLADNSLLSLERDTADISWLVSWLGDNSGILFTVPNEETGTDIKVVKLDGKFPAGNLSTSVLKAVTGGIVPDGKHFYIYGLHTITGTVTLFMLDNESTTMLPGDILEKFNYQGDPANVMLAWSPDGLSVMVAFVGDPFIYRVDVASHEYEYFFNTSAYVTRLVWSPDGTSLFYQLSGSTDNADNGLYRMDVAAGGMPEHISALSTGYPLTLFAGDSRVMLAEMYNYSQPPASHFIALDEGFPVVDSQLDYLIATQTALSPDGSMAVMTACTNDDADLDIYLFDTATGSAQNLTAEDAFSDAPQTSFCAPFHPQ